MQKNKLFRKFQKDYHDKHRETKIDNKSTVSKNKIIESNKVIYNKLKPSEIKSRKSDSISIIEEVKIPRKDKDNLKKQLEQISELEEKLDATNIENNSLKSELQELRIDFEVMEERCKDLRKLNSEVDFKIDGKDKLIKLKDEEINKLNIEIQNLNNEIERIKLETSKNESKKFNDLLKKYNELEEDYTEQIAKLNSETSNTREIKQLYEALKLSHYEMKNQYELLHLKYQSLSDENYHLKRDLLLYERKTNNDNYNSERFRQIEQQPYEFKKNSNEYMDNRNSYEQNLTNSFTDKKDDIKPNLDAKIHNMQIEREKVKLLFI